MAAAATGMPIPARNWPKMRMASPYFWMVRGDLFSASRERRKDSARTVMVGGQAAVKTGEGVRVGIGTAPF